MTNAEVRYEMMKYLSLRLHCNADDFLSDTNKIYKAEKDYELFFYMICFGNAAVARANEKIYEWCKDFFLWHPGWRCFDGKQYAAIAKELTKHNVGLSFGHGMGMVADINIKRESKPIPYKTRIIEKAGIVRFYDDEIEGIFYKEENKWRTLEYTDKIEYILAVYDSDRVIGFIIAEKETDSLYQLGCETLPEYRQKGIATAITIEMTNFLINKSLIPFATLAWSNISSKNVLIKSGYTMAWSDMGSYNIKT